MSETPLSPKEQEAIRHIRNSIMHRGRPPSVRELQALMQYQSPRSAAYILERLKKRGLVRRRPGGTLQLLVEAQEQERHARTVDVPLLGVAPCGTPFLAEENVDAMIPVSTGLARPPHRYFFLRAKGDSMDLAGIGDGDLVLVRQQDTANPGDKVVALIDDEATIKEFHRVPQAVVLKPRSTNKRHKPILLTEDFRIQGVVVTAIPSAEGE